MRISDWSSDVCSSDLAADRYRFRRQPHRQRSGHAGRYGRSDPRRIAGGMTMSQQEDYREGFKQGYKSVKGNHVMPPQAPAMNAVTSAETAFQPGYRRGRSAAGG